MVNTTGKKIELCWVNQFAIPPNTPGASRHTQMASSLEQYGYSTTIVSSSDNYMTNANLSAKAADNFSVIPIGWRGPKNIGKFLKMVSFGNKVQRRRWVPSGYKPDVVIGSSPSLHAALAASNLAKYYQVPFIFEVRDIWPLSLVEIVGLSKHHPLIKYLYKIEKTIISRASRIITLLPNAFDYYKRLGVNEEKIDWIPNGINKKLFTPTNDTQSTNKTTVMYTGAHGHPNGLHTIVDAALIIQSQDPTIKFRLIGSGVLKDQLISYAAKKGVSNITFEHPVNREDVPKLISEADILTANIPKHDIYKYGVSLNKLYEYLASAKPIALASSAAGDPVTMAGVGPVVPADDSVKLAGRILELAVATKEERRSLGLKGRKFVEENNTFDILAKRVDLCIQKVLN